MVNNETGFHLVMFFNNAELKCYTQTLMRLKPQNGRLSCQNTLQTLFKVECTCQLDPQPFLLNFQKFL